MKLGNRIVLVALLDNARISERELARQAGLSHSTVNHLVTGRRTTCSAETAIAISDVLGCPVGMLFRVQRAAEELTIRQHEAMHPPCRGPAAT